jgi:hypothetical protein
VVGQKREPTKGACEFGGMYYYNAEERYSKSNPVTNALSCPEGFTATQIAGASSTTLGGGHRDHLLFYCHKKIDFDDPVAMKNWKPHEKSIQFGGIGGTSNGSNQLNVFQPGEWGSCSNGFEPTVTGYMPGYDGGIYYCSGKGNENYPYTKQLYNGSSINL